MMEVVTMCREAAEAYVPVHPYEICISIRDPGESLRVLSPAFREVLALELHDLDGKYEGVMTDVGIARSLQPMDAARVVDFLFTHAQAKRLVVHCDAGISRSISLAAAIADCFDRRVPNWTVYRRFVEAFNARQRLEYRRPFDVTGPFRWVTPFPELASAPQTQEPAA